MKLHTLCIFACCLAIAPTVQGSTIGKRSFQCPIDGEEFEATVAFSGTSFGQRLDFKKLGPIYQPWPVPTCPSNGFVMFKPKFSDEELSQLRPFILSNGYQLLRTDHTDHYLASRMSRRLEESPWAVTQLVLLATWEAEKGNPDKLGEYLAELPELLSEHLTTLEIGSEPWFVAQQLLANSLRRLRHFEQAREQAEILHSAASLSEDTGLSAITSRLLSIIDAKDSRPRGMTTEDDKYIYPEEES